jgi:glycosyltransferase involved in cell wall biosynthesis
MPVETPRVTRIAYVPFFEASAEKGYTLRMREAFAAFGDVVRYEGIVGTWHRHRARLDVLVLNWTDNDLLDRRTRTVALRKVVKLFAKTIAMRLAAKKLVFVRHNVYPHAVAAGGEENARRWVDRYEKLFDVVLTHSGDESQRPRHYCPHPLYRRVEPIGDSALLRELPSRYFVVFGRIVRYKQLERLMAAFPDEHTLLVIGAVGDKAYVEELAALERPNVLFRPGLINEAEAQTIVSRSAALLISHADRDVIVSSSFFFAMSLGVPVIAVETPYLQWIAPRVGSSLLSLASDLDTLVSSLNDPANRDARSSVASPDAIDKEFGDATTVRALEDVLRLPRLC